MRGLSGWVRVVSPGGWFGNSRGVGGRILGVAGVLLVGGWASGWARGSVSEHQGGKDLQGRVARLEARVTRLEGDLRIPAERPVSSRDRESAARFEEEIEALEARERQVALRAQEALRFVPDLLPVQNGVITSGYSFGRYHPILRIVRPHRGMDIGAPAGTPVLAPAAGTVVRAFRQDEYGIGLDLDHGNGLVTRYGHLSGVRRFQGARVVRGDTLGWVGSTGLSTGPHLHYEVLVNGYRQDPVRFLQRGGGFRVGWGGP